MTAASQPPRHLGRCKISGVASPGSVRCCIPWVCQVSHQARIPWVTARFQASHPMGLSGVAFPWVCRASHSHGSVRHRIPMGLSGVAFPGSVRHRIPWVCRASHSHGSVRHRIPWVCQASHSHGSVRRRIFYCGVSPGSVRRRIFYCGVLPLLSDRSARFSSVGVEFILGWT